jgi:hypothetical protein
MVLQDMVFLSCSAFMMAANCHLEESLFVPVATAESTAVW